MLDKSPVSLEQISSKAFQVGPLWVGMGGLVVYLGLPGKLLSCKRVCLLVGQCLSISTYRKERMRTSPQHGSDEIQASAASP